MNNTRDENFSKEMTRRRMLEMLGYGSLALASDLAAGLDHRLGAAQPPILSTRLTREYGLTYPFVGAGMGFVALPELVAAVSNAGGLGVLGVAPEPPPTIPVRVGQIMALTDKPFGIDFFLAVSPALGPITVDAHIDMVVAAKQGGAPIRVVAFHFDIPKQAWVTKLQGAGINVWAQVPSVDDARAAVQVGVDALVAQGKEAGGHCKSTTPLLALLGDVLRAVNGDILVLAAGGIATGADVAQALTHGAEGVWVGTRLVASAEAYAHHEWKQRIVAANRKEDTVNTVLFGPELPCKPYRVLRTQVVDAFLPVQEKICGAAPDPNKPIGTTTLFPGTPFAVPNVPMPHFSALPPTPDTVSVAGNLEAFGMPAGAGVEDIHDIKPTAQIIAEMMEEAHEIISGRLQP